MNIFRFATLHLCFGIALGVAACSNEPTGRVYGRVVDEFGAPVTGAQVSVDGVSNWSTASDGAGAFAVDGVAAGNRSLVVEKGESAGVFSRQSLRIFVSEDTNLSTVLLPTPPTLVVEKVDTVNEKNAFDLRWSPYRQAGFREYKLYRGKTSGLDETTGELVHVTTDPEATTFVDETPDRSSYFYRAFVMDERGRMAGSNVTAAVSRLLELGFETKSTIFKGQAQVFSAQVVPHSIYEIRIDRKTEATGIWFSAIDGEDEIAFERWPDAPRVIKVRTSELRVKVTGDGEFGVTVSEVVGEAAAVGSMHTVPIGFGESKAFSFELEGGKTYAVEAEALVAGGAYDDGIGVALVCFQEDQFVQCQNSTHSTVSYDYSEFYSISENYSFSPTMATLTPAGNRQVTLVLSGGFRGFLTWLKPNTVELIVKETPGLLP